MTIDPRRWDPRFTTLKHPWLTLFIFLLLTGIFVYGNAKVRRGGVLDNALTEERDPYYQMDRYLGQSFPGTEKVALIYRDTIDTRDDLLEVYRMTERIKGFSWARGRVLSFSEAPNFEDREGVLYTDPYISEDTLSSDNFDMDAFKTRVKRDSSIYGKLVGRNFDYALIVIFLPREHNQEKVYWDLVEVLEERDIPRYERFFKYDIKPENRKWSMGSWVIARETIDLVLRHDTFRLLSVGIAIIFVFFYMSLGSLHQAMISVGVVSLSFIWTRGTIGLLDSLGIMNINEKIYILLTYANNIVQGSSYCLHKFHAFNKEGEKFKRPKNAWEKTSPVDRLILITGSISSGGFLTLYSFKVLTIREMGLLSAFGIGYLTLFSIVLVPALYLAFAKERANQ